MVPSGIYHKDEVKDSVNFYAVQVGIRSGAAKDFKEQLENGIRLDKEHYLRIFPVWFSFKGNIAVHLSHRKSRSHLRQSVEGQGTERHCRTAALLGCR